jgi:hypothetical protein
MVDYKGYLIVGYAVRVHPTSSDWWRSQGVILSPNVPLKTTALNSAKSGWTRT